VADDEFFGIPGSGDAESGGEANLTGQVVGPGALDPTAASLAMQASGQGAPLPPEAAEYFRRQAQMVAIQTEHLHEQRRETIALLRDQELESDLRRVAMRLRIVMQVLTLLVAVGVAAAVGTMIYDATKSRAVIVDVFEAPPGLVSNGFSGRAVAGAVSDQLATLQASTHSSQSARSIASSWTDDIKVQIPQTGLTIGDVDQFLKSRLGHDIHIGGTLVQTANGGLQLTVRGTGIVARSFTGTAAELPRMTSQAAEYIYAQSQPALYVIYLNQAGKYAEAIAAARASFDTATDDERPVILNAWANAVSNASTPEAYREALRLYRAAVAADPDFWVARSNAANELVNLGDEEGSVIEQEAMRIAAGGRPGRASEVLYGDFDGLTFNLQAERAAMIADITANGGYGAETGAQGLGIADVDIQLHNLPAAEIRLQTTQVQPGNDFDMANLAFERGRLAQAHGDTAEALKQAELFGATRYAAAQGDYCWIAQVEEQAGHKDRADAALEKGGHFVDCYRFHADFLDERGDWPGAQRAYAAAVALAPDLPAAYYSWGVALARHGDSAGAIEKLAAANARGPHWADPLKAWGDVLAQKTSLSDAVTKYDEALAYAPAWPELKTARDTVAARIK